MLHVPVVLIERTSLLKQTRHYNESSLTHLAQGKTVRLHTVCLAVTVCAVYPSNNWLTASASVSFTLFVRR